MLYLSRQSGGGGGEAEKTKKERKKERGEGAYNSKQETKKNDTGENRHTRQYAKCKDTESVQIDFIRIVKAVNIFHILIIVGTAQTRFT